MSYLLKNVLNVVNNEPLSVIEYIDKIELKLKELIFPDFIKYYDGNPSNIIDIILKGIENDKAKYIDTVGGKRIKKQEYSDIWNYLAFLYEKSDKYVISEQLFEKMINSGANDASTLNNFAANIIEEMYTHTKFLNHEKLKKAEKIVFDSFFLDMRGDLDSKSNFIKAITQGKAYKNFIFIRSLESQIYYGNKEYFNSFIKSWISIEMSLKRIFAQYLENNKIDLSISEELIEWNVNKLIEVLHNLKYIQENDYKTLRKLNKIRNHLIHGIKDNPNNGDTKESLDLSRKIIPILNP